MKTVCVIMLMALSVGAVQSSGQEQSATVGPPDRLPPAEQPEPAQSHLPSDALNKHLPSWLRLSGELRLRAADIAGDFFKAHANDSYLLTRLRLNLQIRTTSWMNFYFQAQDAHGIGASTTASLPPLQQDTMDLRLGYVEFGDPDKQAFRVRIGRQELSFGEERLIGPANWLNTPRSFDAASATFHINSVCLDAFTASVVKIHDGQFNESVPGNYISGIYSSLSKLVPKAVVEPYLFWRRQSGLLTERSTPGISNFGTAGVRWSGTLASSTDYDVEMAKQAGILGSDTIDAWAGHWLVGYTLAHTRYTPRIFAEYNYASGDGNPHDGQRHTFDQLFPSGHDLYGLTDQVGWKNIRHVRTGAEVKPKDDWTISTKYSAYWLTDAHDALCNAASIVVVNSANGESTYVGQEVDIVSSFKYKSGPVLSFGIGHLFPGTVLQVNGRGNGYTYPYASMLYAF